MASASATARTGATAKTGYFHLSLRYAGSYQARVDVQSIPLGLKFDVHLIFNLIAGTPENRNAATQLHAEWTRGMKLGNPCGFSRSSGADLRFQQRPSGLNELSTWGRSPYGCFYKLGVLLVRALLCRIYSRAPDFRKLLHPLLASMSRAIGTFRGNLTLAPQGPTIWELEPLQGP